MSAITRARRRWPSGVLLLGGIQSGGRREVNCLLGSCRMGGVAALSAIGRALYLSVIVVVLIVTCIGEKLEEKRTEERTRLRKESAS